MNNMNNPTEDMTEFHWMMDMIQSIDVGLVVMDKNYKITVWNTFMENHSDKSSDFSRSKVMFDLFPDTPMEWIKKKIDTVFKLDNRAFSTWEQRPYLFEFTNYHPITGSGTFMYQNISIIPLKSITGTVNHVCLIIYDVTNIANQRKELHSANIQLEELSRTDVLTGLNNRGYWEECLELEYHRFQRNQMPRTLVIFDIDLFKKVNDTYGHQAGDLVIQEVSNSLKNNQRNTDFSGRYGGEEFVIILTNVTERSARIFSERLRNSIEKMLVKYNDFELSITISLGLAELTTDCKSTKEWLERADKALYNAKESGRNKSVLYSNLV
ncbi:MAG: diguanylate cyclase [Enterobacterales bacterium]|jgi:diguanylate cyclase